MIEDIPAGELEIILGYTPSKGQILEMIEYSRTTKKPFGEVARDRSLPPMFFDWDHTGYIDTKDAGRIKIEDYQKLHPWLKLIIITIRRDEEI